MATKNLNICDYLLYIVLRSYLKFLVISKLVCNKIRNFWPYHDNLLIYLQCKPITIGENRLIEEAHVSQQVKSEQHYSVAIIAIKFTCTLTYPCTNRLYY